MLRIARFASGGGRKASARLAWTCTAFLLALRLSLKLKIARSRSVGVTSTPLLELRRGDDKSRLGGWWAARTQGIWMMHTSEARKGKRDLEAAGDTAHGTALSLVRSRSPAESDVSLRARTS